MSYPETGQQSGRRKKKTRVENLEVNEWLRRYVIPFIVKNLKVPIRPMRALVRERPPHTDNAKGWTWTGHHGTEDMPAILFIDDDVWEHQSLFHLLETLVHEASHHVSAPLDEKHIKIHPSEHGPGFRGIMMELGIMTNWMGITKALVKDGPFVRFIHGLGIEIPPSVKLVTDQEGLGRAQSGT